MARTRRDLTVRDGMERIWESSRLVASRCREPRAIESRSSLPLSPLARLLRRWIVIVPLKIPRQ